MKTIMYNLSFLGVLNSPFRGLKLRWYFGEIKHGTPYFLPRKWVKCNLEDGLKAWNKLGELCSQLLTKRRKVKVEGRLSTRSRTGQDGAQRQTTEIVISDMIILDSKRAEGEGSEEEAPMPADFDEMPQDDEAPVSKKIESKEKKQKNDVNEDVNPEDIPF